MKKLLCFAHFTKLIICFYLFCVPFCFAICEQNTDFNVGAGIYDITGPAAETGMMGYGMLKQQTAGILQRLWARAFVIESPCSKRRIVLVTADLGQIFQGITQGVIKKLQEKYGDLYHHENVLITATHTHSGPGGYSTYAFYNLTTLGFERKNFDTIIDGIVKAIERAHTNLQPGTIRINKGNIPNLGHNRSPQAYLKNPETERNHYSANVDSDMTLLRFDTLNRKSIGMMNWFPLHGVSMNNKNRLINGDNKGYAAYLFEKDFFSNYDPKAFVAAFAQTNAGDVSPNLENQEGGTGELGLQKVAQAALPQYQTAKTLFENATTLIKGDIDYRHIFLEMDKQSIGFTDLNSQLQATCKAAIGLSMLAGTQDGEGVGEQGVSCDQIQKTLPALVCQTFTTACQGVKPIVLPTGSFKPYPWTPNVLPLQVIKIGQLLIVAAPFELTTMTGRRIVNSIKSVLPKEIIDSTYIVTATLANAYAGYVATNEEYQIQRYEGASTHFGPWTSKILQQRFASLVKALLNNQPVYNERYPNDLSNFQLHFRPGVIFDQVPSGKRFGDLYQDVSEFYKPGQTVRATFWGGHPKNNYRIQNTFLAVQQLIKGEWKTIRQDRDWDTEYHWLRSGLAGSLITIVWHIPEETPSGKYRLVHYGDAKSFWNQKVTSYEGHSSVFTIS